MADSDGWMIPIAKGVSYFDSEWNSSKTERIFGGYNGFSICNLTCEHLEQITIDPQFNSNSPSWSPDNQQIVFSSYPGGSDMEIFVMKRNGTSARQLTHNNFDNYFPDWSHNGQQILFSGNYEIFVMATDGNNLRSITYNQIFELYPAWRP